MVRPISRRYIELRLLLFALLLVAFGMTLALFGKLSVTTPILPDSINVNRATASDLSHWFLIDESSAAEIVRMRHSLTGDAFPSVFRFRRLLTNLQIQVSCDWNLVTVRSETDVERAYFGSLILLIGSSFGVHFYLRRTNPSTDPFLIPITTLLSGFGLMIAITEHDPLRDTFAFANQAVGVCVLGPIALILPLLKPLQKLPLHRYTYAYAAAAVFFLITLFAFGTGPADTHIQLLGFEPIEIIKVLLVLFIAAYLADRRMTQGSRITPRTYLPGKRDILPLFTIYLFALSLFGAVKDLGPAVLLFGSFEAMLYMATGRSIYAAIGLLLLLMAGYLGDKFGIGFFATRVDMWLHPWSNSNRLGGQLAQGLWGMSTGGIFGSGLGLGGSYFVPRGGSDMAFCSIGEEVGLIGALCLLTLYAIVIYRGFQIAKSGVDDFDRLLAAGITVLIGLQAFVITAGSTGLIPLTGITLPFVSYGTSSLVASYFCIGMLLRLSHKSNQISIPASAPPIFARSAQRVAVALSCLLLLFVGIGRLIWIQGLFDGQIATTDLRIPDADGIFRLHRNPRLIAFADDIPRGLIRDRNGTVLAKNAVKGRGVPYLTGGQSRTYPFGSVGADVILAVEQPKSELNPLGCDATLRGYGSMRDLLPLYRAKDLPFQPVVSGKDVTLALDSNIQRAAQIALNDSANQFGNGCGAAVVLDVRSGAVLAADTAPTFNPNTLTESSWEALHNGGAADNPLLNRAFAGTYTPGSVFKLVTATAALQQHRDNLTFNCRHVLPVIRWKYGNRNFVRYNIRDDEEFVPHGLIGLGDALRVSCNVYFSQLGVALGGRAIELAAQEYGVHQCPDVALLSGDLPDCAYGQGTVEVTPYQMACVSQAIANGGVLAPPTFFVNGAPNVSFKRILSPENAAALAGMMATAVTSGTASGCFPGQSVAGKTGSAQLGYGKPHSWFVGFSPVIRPTIAFSCIIEHGGHGRGAAAMVCRRIVEAAVSRQ